ncbi:MAG: type II secretion system F family protein [Candidatus Liptonbacteria bacterium]
MKFEYQARTKEGESQVGFVEAANRDMAATILGSHNLFVLRLNQTGGAHWYDGLTAFFSGVKRKDMVIFTRQLSTLLEAQLSLEKALSMLFEQTENETLKEAVYQMSQDVAAGLAFSQAMERQPMFSKFFVSMIRSAEVTGKLSEVAGFLADYTEQEAVLVDKVRSALVYPAILIVLFGVVVFIMVTFVFPQLSPVFAESGVALPLYTRIMLGVGDFLSKFWFVVVLVFAFGVIMLIDYLHTAEGKALSDDVKIHAPVFWRVFVPITLTRFGNASRMLIRGGIPLAQAMEIVAETIDNAVYEDVLHEVANSLRSGVLLSEALAEHPEYFPPIVTQMVAVGEMTGQLDQIFTRITGFYQREADAIVNNLVDLIQPLLLVFIAVGIGFLFASILLPIYQLTGSIR